MPLKVLSLLFQIHWMQWFTLRKGSVVFLKREYSAWQVFWTLQDLELFWPKHWDVQCVASNIGDQTALFEATHGTAPKYTGQDKVNPGSVILSGVMMFEHMGWNEAAETIVDALQATILKKTVTYDLERQMEGATLLKCSEFGQAIVDNMKSN